jgi:hypothetical protein
MAETTSNWTEWSLSYAAALIVRRQLEPLNIFLVSQSTSVNDG